MRKIFGNEQKYQLMKGLVKRT